MKDIFPIEIVEYTNENYWVKRNIKSKIIYITIISLIIICILILPLIKIELSSQSRGNIRSINENNTLQSAISAEVERLNLFENQSVKEGDTLVWLRTDVIDEQINRLSEKLSENRIFMEDISSLLQGNIRQINSPKYKAEYNQSLSKTRQQQVSLNQAENEYKTSKKLYEKGVESHYDFSQNENKYNLAQSQLTSIMQESKNNWQAEQTRLELENKDLQSQLLRLEKDKSQYYITAPISGNIVQYAGVKKGNFITAGQTLSQIASGDDLMVECYVSPSDIGYIYEGQNVNIQMDAFDYRQWGLIKGKVKEIVSDVTTVNDQPFFRVRCSMEQNYLSLKNGHRGNLKKGMTLTGRFALAERNLADLLFDKVDNWMNPKIMSNGN